MSSRSLKVRIGLANVDVQLLAFGIDNIEELVNLPILPYISDAMSNSSGILVDFFFDSDLLYWTVS